MRDTELRTREERARASRWTKRPRTYLRTLALAALLGFPVAFAAVLFQTAIHDVIHFVWDVVPEWLDWSEPAGWYVILVPALAGVLVALALRLPGHGGHTPLEGLGLAEVHPVDLVSILTPALATLGLGLVLGPEAPLIALGLGMGAVAVRIMRSQETEAKLLTLAGAFAAVAALFGGPLVAAFLLFEVTAAGGAVPPKMMGRVLLPGFVAAGTGALVFTGVEDWQGLHTAELSLTGAACIRHSSPGRSRLVPCHLRGDRGPRRRDQACRARTGGQVDA